MSAKQITEIIIVVIAGVLGILYILKGPGIGK